MSFSIAFIVSTLVISGCAQFVPIPLVPVDNSWNETNSVYIGGLFPISGRGSPGGRQREAAARLAVREINNKGAILPGKQLRLLSFDTVTEEQPTVRGTLSLCDDYRVLGIVGAATSTESQAAALVAEIFDTSMVSYSATSAALSDKDRYRTFFRTVPPDSFQSRAIVDICVRSGWKHVTIINTNDAYGTSLSTSFQSNAAAAGISVNKTLVIQTTGTPDAIAAALTGEMRKINGKLEKIFVVFSLAADAAKVLTNARQLGLLDGNHAFIGVDGVMQEALFASLNTTAGGVGNYQSIVLAAAGVLGTQPSPGNSKEFQDLLDLWHAENDTAYAGSGPGTTPNLYAPFAFDSVYVYADAIARVLKAHNNDERFLNPSNITEMLKSTNLTGATGPISFDANNDRQGSAYDIRNFQLQADGTVKLVTVGSWNPSAGVSYKSDAVLQYAINVQDPKPVTDAAMIGSIVCASNEVSSGSSCSQCQDTAIFVPADETGGARCEPCSTNYHPSEDRLTCVLDGGIIALIVILIVVFVAIVAALLAWMYVRVKKRRDEEERIALTTPALVWDVTDEMHELSGDSAPGTTAAGVVSTLDKGAPVTVLMKVGEVPTFGVAKGSRMPVMELLQDTIVITNRGNQDVSYTVSVPDGLGAYECSVLPGRGVVKKHASRDLTLRFKLMQTMKVDRHIKIVIEGHGNVYFPLRFEGELSQRLDPDEIELFGKPIGDGAFGTVYRGRYRGTAVAVKVLRRQNELAADQNNNFLKEIALFQKLRNPFIVSFIGASYIRGKLCICTELLERGTVLELIQKARISLSLKYKLMLDTASAIDFLHSNGVLYRDLKPDNLLVFSVSHNASVNCKLSDFGTSRIVDDPKVPMQHTSGIGTPIYMAPEMMDATQKYTLKVDVYSFGMLCWELMAEKQPFNEVKRIWDLPRIVVDGLRPTIDESWPRPIQRLIAEAWMHSPERRPTMKEALAVLQELFETERRTYEKHKKNRKGDDEIADSARPRTANTGNLEELIQKSAAEPESNGPLDTSELARAADLKRSTNGSAAGDAAGEGDGQWESGKKKTKKKVKTTDKADKQ